MTYSEKFESLKKMFLKADKKKFTEDFAVQVTLTDEDCGGTFYLEYKNGSFNVEPYDYVDNSAYINGTATDVEKISKGTVSTELLIGGNQEVVKMLASAFKAPAKKTSSKKVEKKAEPAKNNTDVKKTPTKKATTKKVPETKAATAKKEAKKTTVVVEKKASK